MNRLLCALCLLLVALAAWAAPETLTIPATQTAGICGLRPLWNRPVVLTADGLTEDSGRGTILKGPRAVWAPELRWHGGMGRWEPGNPGAALKPGALAFDAVHRSLLVRFPDAADALAAKVKAGYVIRKVELRLPFKGTEKLSVGYREPSSFIGDMWDVNTPRWHAVAWALRQPWLADPQLGPTFNAAINGARYWAKYGAADEARDRFPAQFGPAEVSAKACDTLDLTDTVTNPLYGKSLGERLRRLADCGYLVRKWEYYDAHFINPGYEWAIATGGRGILTGTPELVVTLEKGRGPKLGALPEAVDFAALAGQPQGKPTLAMPTADEFARLKAKYSFANGRPAWMPDWQWARVQELYNVPGWHTHAFPDTIEGYASWLDNILSIAPRTWEGFQAADQLMLFYDYKDALPSYIADHWHTYWTAWLMPERDSMTMTHNQYHQIWTPYRGFGSDYVDKTHDWKGDKSFYRESYTTYMSTMNFNHTAAVGALLGGQFIGSPRAIADGRYGLEMFPLRLWAWYDGTQQEGIDHYYFSITMTDQKTFADYAPTVFDRLMGKSILAKSMEDLSTCFHPVLKRYVSTGLRTTPFYATQVQDGVQHIAHTMTKDGALTDVDKVEAREKEIRAGAINRPPVIGHDLPPRRVAMQTLKSPWAPAWVGDIFEHKALPFEVVSTWRQWGAFRTEPKWKKSYMGRYYGLASFDFMTSPTLNLQALWTRKPEKLTTAADLGQLLLRFGVNRTNFIDTYKGGTLGNMGGSIAVLQGKNKLLAASSPQSTLGRWPIDASKIDIKSVQTSIALFALMDKAPWKLYVDGQEVTQLPFACKAGAHITVHDGVSYVGIIPLPSTNLGRDIEVLLHEGGTPIAPQTGDNMRESLIIDNYFIHSDTKIDLAAMGDKLDAATGGFYVELGDATEYKDFTAFQAHFAGISPVDKVEGDTHNFSAKSGADLLEMGFNPVGIDSDSNDCMPHMAMPYRRINGQWPYLPEGIERDTPVSVLGRKGTLEKNGARLLLPSGQMGYLTAEPTTGTYRVANPLPDATWFRAELPGGVTLEADGQIGLGFFTLQPATGTLEIDYATAPGQSLDGMARCLIVSGLAKAPTVTFNGAPLTTLQRLSVGGKDVWLVPLRDGVDLKPVTDAAIATARESARLAFKPERGAFMPSTEATMVYEKGEHYLLTKPAPGVWHFQRQWPSGVAFEVKAPGGMTVGADGRLAIIHMTLDTAHNSVAMYAPKYLYDAVGGQAFDMKATALVISGIDAAKPPTVTVNGVKLPVAAVTLNGKPVFVAPLYGKAVADVVPELEKRVKAAAALLPAPTEKLPPLF
jgi:hypothetical protein